MFSNPYRKMKMTLYATITPSASNKLWDPCFMVDFMQQTNIKYVVPRKIWCLFTFMIVFSLCELSFLLFASVNTRYVNMFMQASDRLNLFYFNFQYIYVIEKQREREERDRKYWCVFMLTWWTCLFFLKDSTWWWRHQWPAREPRPPLQLCL